LSIQILAAVAEVGIPTGEKGKKCRFRGKKKRSRDVLSERKGKTLLPPTLSPAPTEGRRREKKGNDGLRLYEGKEKKKKKKKKTPAAERKRPLLPRRGGGVG